MQVNVMQAWLTFSSVILAFSFICANSIRVVGAGQVLAVPSGLPQGC